LHILSAFSEEWEKEEMDVAAECAPQRFVGFGDLIFYGFCRDAQLFGYFAVREAVALAE
jgi:hypothetical protein